MSNEQGGSGLSPQASLRQPSPSHDIQEVDFSHGIQITYVPRCLSALGKISQSQGTIARRRWRTQVGAARKWMSRRKGSMLTCIDAQFIVYVPYLFQPRYCAYPAATDVKSTCMSPYDSSSLVQQWHGTHPTTCTLSGWRTNIVLYRKNLQFKLEGR